VIFTDGACEPKNPGGIPTYGFVIYRNGTKLAEDCGLAGVPFSKEATNNVAEYVGLKKALERVLSLGLQHCDIEVKSDSRLLVNQVRGEFVVKSRRLKPYYNKVKELLPSFRRVSFRWVPREENEEADALSKTAYLVAQKQLRRVP
jgi:ribonuclease HI